MRTPTDSVAIAALGYALPPEKRSSEAIEAELAPVYERLGLRIGRLELMTGIESRRHWPGAVRPSEVAALAGEDAIQKAGIDRSEIGCLIHASVSRDFLEPATAHVVHETLGLSPDAITFDLSNACLGMMSAVEVAEGFIRSGRIRHALIVAGENGKPLVDATIQALLTDPKLNRKRIKPAIASLTIGSGAAAILLSREDLAPKGHRVLASSVLNASEHNKLCQGGVAEAGHAPQDGGVSSGSALSMATDAEALLHAGISLAKANYERLKAKLSGFAPDRVITHQVGKAHHQGLFKALGLDPARAFTTFKELGNVGSVSLPITLAMAEDAGFIQPGHTVALLGIGSGLSCMMMAVRW